MQLKKPPLELFVINVRSRMLPEKNNCSKMLLKKLPIETFVKIIRSRMVPENYPEKCR